MANSITLRQLNTSGSYDNLYPRTTANHTMLTEATSTKYGLTDGNAEEVISVGMNFISIIGGVSMYVKDPSGNPVAGAIAQGIQGSPATNSSGFVSGILVSNPVIVKSPYIDLRDVSVDVANYAGTTAAVNVVLSAVEDGTILRYTTSASVKFNGVAKTIDVCCVGGGGSGGVPAMGNAVGYGGGGGGIVNQTGLTVQSNQYYQLTIGSGGVYGNNIGRAGGATTFLGVAANGGGGGGNSWSSSAKYAGTAGATGCGDGGYDSDGGSNTTVSEFNDGKTFYSGGGGSGYVNVYDSKKIYIGGSPNGADGAYAGQTQSWSVPATVAGIGGGGGGGVYYDIREESVAYHYISKGSSGGSGLVAIRIHTT